MISDFQSAAFARQHRNLAMPSTINHLQCSRPTCSKVVTHSALQNLCPVCGSPLVARYNLSLAKETLTLDALHTRPRSMWRYEEVLPDGSPITLGEGVTPLIHVERLGGRMGLNRLFVKDEGLNPTGSFKA